jgi:hypothetical protein
MGKIGMMAHWWMVMKYVELFPAGIIGIWEAWQYEKRGGKSQNKTKRTKPTTFAIFAAEEGSMEVESTASP